MGVGTKRFYIIMICLSSAMILLCAVLLAVDPDRLALRGLWFTLVGQILTLASFIIGYRAARQRAARERALEQAEAEAVQR